MYTLAREKDKQWELMDGKIGMKSFEYSDWSMHGPVCKIFKHGSFILFGIIFFSIHFYIVCFETFKLFFFVSCYNLFYYSILRLDKSFCFRLVNLKLYSDQF